MKQTLLPSFFFLLSFLNCVPYQQQIKEKFEEEIAYSKKGTIVKDSQLFQERIATERELVNPRYRSILDQSLKRRLGEPVMKIYGNYLLFEVSHGGGKSPSYQLIWDGSFQVDDLGNYHVHLLYSWQIKERNRSKGHNYLAFELNSLQTLDTHELTMHFFGISDEIKYSY